MPQDKPICRSPNPGVPQILTFEGKFIRVAYNTEGYVILGYQASNRSIGEEWMLLEVGMTVLDKTPDYRLTRAALSLDTPDGKTLPLPSVVEQREANPQRDSATGEGPARLHQLLSASASRACGIGFFPDLESRALPFDEVDLSKNRACLGRLYFRFRAASRTASIGST